MFRRFVANYIERHQHRANQLLHLIGLPTTFIAPAVMAIQEEWEISGGCFVLGYAFQFLGHAIEGNDAGELIVLKRMLGVSYIEFGSAKRRNDNEPKPRL